MLQIGTPSNKLQSIRYELSSLALLRLKHKTFYNESRTLLVSIVPEAQAFNASNVNVNSQLCEPLKNMY
jgi:hypothetical protein